MHSTVIKLKNYKETKNLTIKTLAEVLGVNEVTVSAWLRGINTPRAETLNTIEKFLENQIKIKLKVHLHKEKLKLLNSQTLKMFYQHCKMGKL